MTILSTSAFDILLIMVIIVFLFFPFVVVSLLFSFFIARCVPLAWLRQRGLSQRNDDTVPD